MDRTATASTREQPLHLVRRILVAMVAVTAGATLLGLLLTHPLDGSIGQADRSAVQQLVDTRTQALDRATSWITWLSDTVPVAVLWIAGMAVAWWWTRAWVAPAAIMVAIGGEKLCYLVTTLVVGRDRPPVPPLGEVHATSSFPSGHTGSAAAVYGVAVALAVWSGRLRTPRRRAGAWLVVAIITVAVGFARVYRGHHFPSDVVAGAALGALWLVLAWSWVLRPHPARGAAADGASRRRARS